MGKKNNVKLCNFCLGSQIARYVTRNTEVKNGIERFEKRPLSNEFFSTNIQLNQPFSECIMCLCIVQDVLTNTYRSSNRDIYIYIG